MTTDQQAKFEQVLRFYRVLSEYAELQRKHADNQASVPEDQLAEIRQRVLRQAGAIRPFYERVEGVPYESSWGVTIGVWDGALHDVWPLGRAQFAEALRDLMESFIGRLESDPAILDGLPTTPRQTVNLTYQAIDGGAMPVPVEITQSLARFSANHPDPSRVAFIMMRFSESPAHAAISNAIRTTLLQFGMVGLRVDDKEYHEDLYWNVMTYIYGSSLGIAVFERIEEESFNPNVAYEVGFMRAIGKPVCLLKDRYLKELQADLIGKLYKPFDPQNPGSTIPPQLSKWLRDQDKEPNTP